MHYWQWQIRKRLETTTHGGLSANAHPNKDGAPTSKADTAKWKTNLLKELSDEGKKAELLSKEWPIEANQSEFRMK